MNIHKCVQLIQKKCLINLVFITLSDNFGNTENEEIFIIDRISYFCPFTHTKYFALPVISPKTIVFCSSMIKRKICPVCNSPIDLNAD